MKLKRKVTIFGKQISATLVALLAMVGLASAALLSYYGQVVGTAYVSQSVRLDGTQCTGSPLACDLTEAISAIAGNTYYTEHLLENEASVIAVIDVIKPVAAPPEFDSVKYKIVSDDPADVDCSQETGYTDPIDDFSLPGNSVDHTLCIEYKIKINTAPGSYSVTTQVVPS